MLMIARWLHCYILLRSLLLLPLSADLVPLPDVLADPNSALQLLRHKNINKTQGRPLIAGRGAGLSIHSDPRRLYLSSSLN
jgi:hypothetical protein